MSLSRFQEVREVFPCDSVGQPERAREREENALSVSSKPHVVNLGRAESHWEDTLLDLTPVEEIDGLVFKREDKYAPLGYGCINGSKLRQLIWLVKQYIEGGGRRGLISGASVHSPQLSMGTAVANHFGLPSTHVIGATTPEASLKHVDVEMATLMGAEFQYSRVAYNKALQTKVQSLLQEPEYRGYFYLEYGVSLDHWNHPSREIEAFHRIGAEQVKNIPECDSLIIPAGSCNSLVSILYGLAIYKPKVRNLVLIEIGPNKRDWVHDRMIALQSTLYSGTWRTGKPFGQTHPPARILDGSLYSVEYHDLHRTGYVSYQDMMTYQHGSIEFHPRYEGKVMTYLADQRPDLLSPDNVIWVIAGEGKREKFMRVIARETMARNNTL